MPLGVYIHIPFCTRKCEYCDFYSLPFQEDAADSYTKTVLRAIRTHPWEAQRADTLYLGGGTPSLLGARRLGAILEAAANQFGLDAYSEITLEANPGTVDLVLLRQLRAAGFNRVSLGIQSLDDAQLRALGRMHSARQAREAVEWAHAAGFARISADLMLGIPGQTEKSLAWTLEELAPLPVEHLSAYLLKIEEDTPFGRRPPEHLPEEDRVETLYLRCVESLEAMGLAQYEISNFARPGGESRHNLKYWRCEDYLGIGPAAHSFVKGKRFFFPRDLAAFAEVPEPFKLIRQDGPGGDWREQLMLRLRLREGIDAALLRQMGTDPGPLLHKAAELSTHGLCTVQDETVSLTPRGFLLSNTITTAFLEAMEQ